MKEKRMKRILPVLMCMLFAFTVFLNSGIKTEAADANGTCGDNAAWSYDAATKTLIISGEGAISDYEYDVYGPWNALDITKVVVGDGITAIGNWAFAEMDNLTMVEGCKNVTAINYSAFRGSGKLTTMPELSNVTSLANYVFCDAVSLTDISGLNNITVLEDSVFRDCKKLTELPDFKNVTSIKDNAFSGCTNLVTLPAFENVESVGSSAFYKTGWISAQGEWPCVNGILAKYSGTENIVTIPEGITGLAKNALPNTLTEVTFPASMSVIGDAALNSNKSLTKITFSEGTTKIGSTAFYKCTALTSVEFPKSLVEIGNLAFNGCTSLTEVVIPENVKTVGSSAFADCTALTALTVNGTGTHLGDYAFKGCTVLALEGISCGNIGFGYSVFTGTGANYYFGKCGNDGAMYKINKEGDTITIYKFGNEDKEAVLTVAPLSTSTCADIISSIKKAVVEDGITGIGNFTFDTYANLAEIVLPKNLTRIGSNAFRGTGLSEFEIPKTVTYIDYYAFANMKNLTSIVIPEAVTYLGNYFIAGSAVTDLTLKANIDYSSYSLFEDCDVLEKVVIEKGSTGWGLFNNAPLVKTLTIGAGVTEMDDGSFSDMKALETLNLENGQYDEIPSNAFSGCTSLKEVVIPENVLAVGSQAFRGCTSLEKVTFYEGLETIHRYAFAECTSLKEAEIPLSVTDIGDYAFNGVLSDEQGKEDTFVAGEEFLIRGYVNTEAERYASRRHFNCTFEPIGGDISKCTMTLSPYSFTYDGTAKEPTVTVKTPLSGTELVCGTMYTEPVYENNIEAGKNASVSIEGIGEWYGTLTKKFEIIGESSGGEEPEQPENPTISEEEMMYMYEVMIEMGLIDQSTTKFSQEQYEETIAMFAEFGYSKADAEYFMKQYGFWGGSPSVDEGFGEEPVYRVSGASRYETSYKTADVLKEQLGVDKFDTAIIAYGKNFPDALAGSYLAGKTNAPILMINDKFADELTSYVKENVQKGGTLYILGGEGVIPAEQLNGLKEYDVCRLAGKTRYETNLQILEEAGVTSQDILVCTGKNFADSLSASATGNPILLVNNKELTDVQKEFLAAHAGNKYYIIGGTGAVSAEMEAMISEYGPTERISGKSRYETSVKIAEEFFSNASVSVLASAKNFPDGLCGGPLAMSKNAPLILTAAGKESVAVDYMNKYNIGVGAVLGGEGAVEDETVKSIYGVPEISIW